MLRVEHRGGRDEIVLTPLDADDQPDSLIDLRLLVVKRGPNAGSRFLLDQPVTLAGRHPISDIFLDDVTVSRRHAEFRWQNDELHIADVDSLHGTYVNREPVASAVLVNGDEVQIGKFRLVFVRSKNDDSPGGTR